MRHVWERHPDSETIRRPCQRVRVCRLCGIEQTWESEYEWGRIVRRYWHPKSLTCEKVKAGRMRKLGSIQTSVLHALKSHGYWSKRAGWRWSTERETERIILRLVDLGFVRRILNGDFIQYKLTKEGLRAVEPV